MQSTSDGYTKNNSGEPPWYQAYFAAMTERDRKKALVEIERARHAIQERTDELHHLPANNSREIQDLTNASTYLGILLLNMNAGTGSLLWD
jgi:hypothetical protein